MLFLGELEGAPVVAFAVPGWDALCRRITSAEADVLFLALSGRSNAEIAAHRGRSVRTVANQLASAYRKLGMVTRRRGLETLPVGGSATMLGRPEADVASQNPRAQRHPRRER